MRAFLLDRDTLTLLAEIDDAASTIVTTRSYYGTATVELTIGRRKPAAPLIVEGSTLLYVPGGVHNLIYLIERRQEDEDGSSTDLLTFGGRGIDGVAISDRLVYPAAGLAYDALSATHAETAMKHYVAANAGASAAAARQVPNLTIAADSARGTALDTSGRYQYVLDMLMQIGQTVGMGWEITYSPTTSKFVFDVIVGVDRTSTVYLDFALDSLAQWHQLDTLVGSKTDVIVGGQGDGVNRDIAERPAVPPSGWSRREAFLDATDIPIGSTSLLQSRGDAFIAANGQQQALSAVVRQFGSYQYERDYDLGDIVTVRNIERDVSYAARIISVKTTYSGTAAPVVEAVVGRPFPGDPGQLDFSGGAADNVSVSSIANGSVALAKLANPAAHTVLGNNTSSAGPVVTIAGPAAGAGADITVDATGAVGTADTFAPAAHGHKLATSAATPLANAVAGAAGTSGHSPSRDDHVHPLKGALTSAPSRVYSTSTLTGPTVLTDVPGLTVTFTPAVDEYVRIDVAMYIQTSAAAAGIYYILVVDGVAQPGQAYFYPNAANEHDSTVSRTWWVALAHGSSHTLKIQANKYTVAGGKVIAGSDATTMDIARFAQ